MSELAAVFDFYEVGNGAGSAHGCMMFTQGVDVRNGKLLILARRTMSTEHG